MEWILAWMLTFMLSEVYGKHDKTIIKFGAFIPSNVMSLEESIIFEHFLDVAIHEFGNNEHYSIQKIAKKTSCDGTVLSEETSKFVYIDKVDIILGPHCSQNPCQRSLESANFNQMPILAYKCDDADFTDIKHFLNVRPAMKQRPRLVADIFMNISRKFEWKHIGIIYSRRSGWPAVHNTTAVTLQQNGFDVASFQLENYGNPSFLMEAVKKEARILLFLCSTEDIVGILNVFQTTIEDKNDVDEGTNRGEWGIFTLDYDSILADSIVTGFIKRDVVDENFIELDLAHTMKGVFNIRAAMSRDQANEEYQKRKATTIRLLEMVLSRQNETTETKSEAKVETYISEATYLYDGLMIYKDTIEKLIKEYEDRNVEQYLNSEMIPEFLRVNNMTLDEYIYNNITNRSWYYPDSWRSVNTTSYLKENRTIADGPGWYYFNDSLPVIEIERVKNELNFTHIVTDTNNILERVKNYSFSGLSGVIRFTEDGFRIPTLLIENIDGNRTLEKWTDIETWMNDESLVWYGGFPEAPRDVPECGFSGICKGKSWELTIIMTCIVAFIFVSFVSLRAYKMQKYENDLNSKASTVKFKDLTTDILLPRATLSEIIAKKGELNKITGIRKLPVFLNGQCLMLKKLPKTSVFIDRKVLMEFKHLRDLNHPNINKFWGATTFPPDICFLHEYCAKGSLYDILSKEDVQLDWDFKHTFINDIATAMLAIHESPVKVHGHLTSKNCLINHRWVIEVGDFGLSEFRKQEVKPSTESLAAQENMEQKRSKDLLWTAPEHLTLPVTSSKPGDVYSFGIIVSEIINQRPPYAERDEMQSHQIIHYVRKRCIPPFRPHVTLKIGLDNKLVNLMRSCWSEAPEERPTFKNIKPIVKTIRGNKVEIIDNMISMMEKYTNELEKSVKEGTDILKKERSKNNEFLYKSLPKPIGDIIIGGGAHISPHDAPNQALLMLTIHDFSRMGYPPLQCMDILNDFQKLTDKVLLQHKNVYRLYSFREESMFCSNVQGFRPEAEAQDLLSVAIKIVNARDLFPWRHIRNRKLQLRVTLHCGPGTSIVIGNKVPTYCCLGNHFELTKTLNANSPEEKIVMTKEFREQVKLKRDEIMKVSVEVLVCTYIGKVKPIVVKEPPKQENAKTDKLHPYNIPGPSMFPPKEKVNDIIKYMDVGADIETMFDKWYKVDKAKK